MSIVLLFIDAENVSKSQVEYAIEDARSQLEMGDLLVGKFYGAKETLGSLVDYYLEYGFEFVDTSIFSPNKKNLTDMKIIVDSIWDLFSVNERNVKALYLLSNDCDFQPVIHKLKSCNVSLRVAATDAFGAIRTVDDFAKYLKFLKFLPITKENVLCVLYEKINEEINDVSLSPFVYDYVNNRMSKLFNATAQYGVCANTNEEFVKTFSFSVFNELMRAKGYTDVRENLNLFTTKMFGSCLSKRDIDEVVGRM